MKRFLPALFLFLLCPNLFASNTIAQHPVAVQSAGVPTVTKTFASACTSGSLLVAVFTSDPKNATMSVSDPTNGMWHIDADISNLYGSPARVIIASVQNTASTALTVTGTSGAGNNGWLQIYEITGAAASSVVDVALTLNNNATPSLTIAAAANDTIIAALASYPGSVGNDSGYTADFGPTPGSIFYHRAESIADAGAAGNKTINWNGTTEGDPTYVAFAVVAYKTSGGGGGGGGAAPPSPMLNLLSVAPDIYAQPDTAIGQAAVDQCLAQPNTSTLVCEVLRGPAMQQEADNRFRGAFQALYSFRVLIANFIAGLMPGGSILDPLAVNGLRWMPKNN